MKPSYYLSAIFLLLSSCGRGGGDPDRSIPGDGDGTSISTISVDDVFAMEGRLQPSADAPEGYESKLTRTYQLQVEHTVGISIEKISLIPFCADDANVVGPFFELSAADKSTITTNEFSEEQHTALKDFPGKLTAGAYSFTLTVFGNGDCQFSYQGRFKNRSDLAVLKPGEWDSNLSGSWAFEGWGTEQRSWTFSSELVTQQRNSGAKELATDVDYLPKIDASQIPGKLELTVKTVRSLSVAEGKVKAGDTVLCIYRVFPGYEDKTSLWLTCRGSEAGYPQEFDYPRREYQR